MKSAKNLEFFSRPRQECFRREGRGRSTFTADKTAAKMASFGLRYYGGITSRHFGIAWRVEIEERGYAGAAESIVFDGTSPPRASPPRP